MYKFNQCTLTWVIKVSAVLTNVCIHKYENTNILCTVHLYYVRIYGEQTSVCVGYSQCACNLPWLICGCYAVAMSNCPCIRACMIDRAVC